MPFGVRDDSLDKVSGTFKAALDVSSAFRLPEFNRNNLWVSSAFRRSPDDQQWGDDVHVLYLVSIAFRRSVREPPPGA